MLNDSLGYPVEVGATNRECKPDYEQLIERAKSRLDKAQNLENAIWDYLGDRSCRDKLAEMVGELVSEKRLLNMEIDRLITAQEKEK